MISFKPLQGKLRKLARRPIPDFLTQAEESWEIEPGTMAHIPAAIFLPDQPDRIRDTAFAPIADVIRSFRGGYDYYEDPTVAHRFRNVDLVNGVLYARGSQLYLRDQQSKPLIYRSPTEVMRGVLYESWTGNQWFGTWLREDCLTYLLTEPLGQAVTTAPEPAGHVPRYEQLLRMTPRRVTDVHFEELILLENMSSNEGKAQRARELRNRLLAGRTIKPLPGVFILRGKSGDMRVLENERQIADKLAEVYGFAVLDPATKTVDQIVEICGQAAVIAGVEGSHLAHGLVTMPPDATLFVIQPPDRTVASLKVVTDRQGQRFAFVVAEGTQLSFRVSWDEVRRTLDLVYS